ncbi:hypothetical protein NO2_0758 [Candidatus Termititenax persephonae]|uniref:Cell surface protein SprA n=1 Tax=Candidatus Termititenax persephonae TaxID=2218525 RepID=A0A388TGD5_9BACT|nr:hypothetical protein NO2_0758 [Candidatus Termititenax persephonae]
MRKFWLILLILLLLLPAAAKDPMKRGKSAFQPGRAYPQVDISGYEELEYNNLDYSGDPQKYQNTAEYTSLPASVKVYDGLRHRRLIDLEGQINEKLYVRYKIMQDPDLPQETDIYVEYDRFSVYFGKYDAALNNGDLFSMTKGIDGLHADYLGENFEVEAIYGEERSHEREFAFNGTGKREYSLGETNIVEGTVKVFLNGNRLTEDDDYHIDYFDGVIVFNNILSVLDNVKGSYEYLDPIEDFLPIASKIRLSGIQHRYKNYRGGELTILTDNAVFRYTPADLLELPAPPTADNIYLSVPEGYRVILPEGTALFTRDKFRQNEKLQFVFTANEDFTGALRADFQDGTQELVPLDGQYTLERLLTSANAVGENNLFLVFHAGSSENETVRKVPYVIEPARVETVSNLTKIQLDSYPLISFSEKITYAGQVLTRYEDYQINYAKGLVTFLREIPDNAYDLEIDYAYYLTERLQEVLKGDETRGPYKLTNRLIVPESAVVVVNNLKMLPNVDYKLDERAGQISFVRNIKSVDSIQVDYRHYNFALPQGQAKKERFTISSYFVQEQAKAAEAEGVESYTVSGGDLEVEIGYDVSLNPVTKITVAPKYMPIMRFVEVQMDNAAATIREKSEYSGQILVAGHPLDTASIKVSFEQGKTSQAPQLYFSGSNQATLYLERETPSFARPLVYESVILEVRRTGSLFYVPLEYRRDYIIGETADLPATIGVVVDSDGKALVAFNPDAWQRGIITFITGNSQIGYSPDPSYGYGDSFRLTYKISNAESTDPGDILHQTYGTKFSYSPVDWFRADVEYNESHKQYQRAINSHSVSANGAMYNSSSGLDLKTLAGIDPLEIVEDSEKVYVNERLQTKNDQYTLAYNGGTLRFHSGMVFSPSDNIRVEFDYYDAVGAQEQVDDRAKAAKVDLTLRLGSTDITAGYVTVDAKYDPVGNPPNLYPKGTEAKNVIVRSRPMERLNVYSRLEQQQNIQSAYDDGTDRYGDTVYQNYKVDYGFNTNDNIALAYNRTDVNVPAVTMVSANEGFYAVDTRQQDYQMDLNIGPSAFRTGVFLKNAESFTDEKDQDNPFQTYNRNARLTNFFQPLKDLTFSTSYARNLDEEFKDLRSLSESLAYSEIVRYNPWTIDSSYEYSGADYLKEQSLGQDDYSTFTKTIGNDRRQIFNISFRRPPELSSDLYEELYLHYDNTYYRRVTDLYNQSPDVSRLDNFNATLRPYDIVSLGYDNRHSDNLLENRNRTEYYQENVYKLSKFYPAKYLSFLPADFLLVNKVEYSRRTNENGRDWTGSTTERTYTLDNYYTLTHTYTLNPWDNLTIDLDFTNKDIERFSETLYANKSYGSSESQEPEDTQSLKLKYLLPEFFIARNIDYAWEMGLSQRKINKATYQVDNAGNITTTTNRDDLYSGKHTMLMAYNYFTSFTNTHALQTLEEYKRKTGDGSRYSYGQTDQANVRYDLPFFNLGLTGGFTRVYNLQFIRYGDLVDRAKLTNNDYQDKLRRFDDTQRYMVDYTPLTWLVFDASLYFRHIDQSLVTGHRTAAVGKTHGTINSRSYEAGATYKPLLDMSLRYGWKQNYFDLGFGEEKRFTAKYTPLKFDFGELSYNYENLETYGKGTNDPEQTNSLDNLNGFVQTRVVDREDIKVNNTLTFKVNKDISALIIDNIVIDINLTRLHFWDKVNPEFSYSLNAFYAKGTINF